MLKHLQIQSTIFDRNRPWNCEYCQPKIARNVDGKLATFNRKRFTQVASRFMIKQEFYTSRKTNELLSRSSHTILMGRFKEYLIYDDIYEFLSSLYPIGASLDILDKHAVFYNSLQRLDVLCQYREEQIKDRHLVLFGLKPSYVRLDKAIQDILVTNNVNKLRLLLT